MEWDEKKDSALAEAYPRMSPREVAEALSEEFGEEVTADAVKARAQAIGAYNRHGYDGWTQEEVDAIREWYPVEGKKIAKRLPGRAIKSIQQKACRLGVKRRKAG